MSVDFANPDEMPSLTSSWVQMSVAVVFGFLPSLTNLKIADLQFIDIFLLLLFLYCIAKFFVLGFTVRTCEPVQRLVHLYGAFLFVVVILAIFSVRLEFYPLDVPSLLKRPLILSISKLLQLAATICGFLWITYKFIKNGRLLDQAMDVYWVAGIVSSWWALLSCPLVLLLHLDADPSPLIGAYVTSESIRARGFFVEGGPFGAYLVSVFVLGVIRRWRTGARLGKLNIIVLSFAFLLSSSKAGFLLAAILLFYYAKPRLFSIKSLTHLIALLLLLCGVAVQIHLTDRLAGYVNDYMTIEKQIATRGDDYNLVLGRISAMYIVPRMIVAHPLAGIGFGNYPLMRNNPNYLENLPAVVDVEDHHSVGLFGLAAEIGIPTTLFFVLIIFAPYRIARGLGPLICTAALFQPVVYAMAAQVTFFYPWFISACVIGVTAHAVNNSSR